MSDINIHFHILNLDFKYGMSIALYYVWSHPMWMDPLLNWVTSCHCLVFLYQICLSVCLGAAGSWQWLAVGAPSFPAAACDWAVAGCVCSWKTQYCQYNVHNILKNHNNNDKKYFVYILRSFCYIIITMLGVKRSDYCWFLFKVNKISRSMNCT